MDTNEVFEPNLTLDISSRPRILSRDRFDDMEDDHDGVVRDWFSGCRKGIFLQDWKLRFCMWQKEKR